MNERDRKESVEIMVDIYECADTVRHHDVKTSTGSVLVKSRKQRAFEVCLGLMCAFLLTAVIVLIIQRKHLLTHITELNEEREQILKRNNNLTEERQQILKRNNNLTEEGEKLLTNNKRLTAEKEDLQIKNKIVSEEQIKLKFDELYHGLNKQDQRSDNFKWIYYNFSFYYISSERKSWEDSRGDCQQRRADLLIIKSPQEKEFVKKLAVSDFWIGLKKTQEVWTWPDGGSVANWFWSFQYSSQPYQYCALMSSSGWKTASCADSNYWICKKTII